MKISASAFPIVFLSSSILISGCAANNSQAPKIISEGNNFHMFLNGNPTISISYASIMECESMAGREFQLMSSNAREFVDKGYIRISCLSQNHPSLKYNATLKQVITNRDIEMRFTSKQACEAFKNQSDSSSKREPGAEIIC